MKKIVFTGGGTLGHVMPNLYLMEELKDYDISYIGGAKIEKEKVKDKCRYFEIQTIKFERGKFWRNFKIPIILIKAIRESKRILKDIHPDVVFSKGGYVSLPVCLAARKLRIPIIAHESDATFGLANRIILRLCKTMCVNFPSLVGKNKKIVYTGPIFSKIYDDNTTNKSKYKLNENVPTIAIIGGSLGSKIINEVVFQSIKELKKKYNIIHIVGKGNLRVKSHDNYNAIEQTDDMVNIYNIADLVIGRSGAGVTAECFYKNVPMILIPLENRSSRGDQLLNAKYYEDKGIAKIIREKDLTPEVLIDTIEMLDLTEMQKKYMKQKQINGRQKVIKLIRKY